MLLLHQKKQKICCWLLARDFFRLARTKQRFVLRYVEETS